MMIISSHSDPHRSLLNTITNIQSMFITNTDSRTLFEELLSCFIFHTESEYGFISEVFYRQNGEPYLKSRALTNISWNEETKALYDENVSRGMEFTNLKSLFGTVLTTGKAVISDDPSNDPRRCGLPNGHPALYAFMGIPLYNGETMVGMIGMANRPGGYSPEDVEKIKPLISTTAHIIEGYRIDQQRRIAEESLRKSEKSLANAQRIAKIGNWDWDIVNNGLWWSDEIYRIFGVAPQDFGATYEAFLSFVHPEDRESVKNAVNEALQKKVKYSINHRIILIDGSIKTVHEMAEVVFSEDGNPVSMSGTVQDITETIMTEEALKKTERQYRNLFEESKDVIFITTPDGTILDINPAGLDLFGYSSMEEIKSTNAIDFYVKPSEREKFKSYLKVHGFVKDFDVCAKRKDGFELTLNVTATAEKGQNGKITSIRGIARDITERKRLEQQLLHIQKMEAIGRLTGGIAHDFNNILTGITGYANILYIKDDIDETARDYSNKIITLTERAAKLTQGLLTFSRKQTMDLRPINLNNVIRDFAGLLSKLIRSDIELSLNLTDLELIIQADSGQIEQVIMNLITNANDAMPHGGRITISTEAASDNNSPANIINGNNHHCPFALLKVSDTGLGMDEETQKRIFEPFFTTKGIGKGTGLGLSIIHGIVTSHNGIITVNSTSGSGTDFRIYFPLTAANLRSLQV